MANSSSSAWMLLPLLLVFFHTFHQLPCAPTFELTIQINKLGEVVKDCSLHCSLDDITNKNCHFLNLTEAFKEMESDQKPACVFPEYFITGLTFYENKLKDLPAGHCKKSKINFTHLRQKLNNTILTQELCEWEDKLQSIISPHTLHEVLEKKIQRYNSAAA